MIRNHQILKLISTFRTQISASNNARRYISSNPLCTIAETLPSANSPSTAASSLFRTWVNSQKPESTDPDEDFVIPSLASWIDSQTSKVMHFPNGECDSDVDQVCEILKKEYSSYDKVVEELNGCEVSVSNGLIEKVLKRFDNDWIPAFGVFTWAKSQTGYEHTPEVFNTMVDILGKAKKFDLMWDLVKEMQQLEGYVTLATMRKVMRRLVKATRYTEAVAAFREIEKFGVCRDGEAIAVLMAALVKGNALDSVDHAYQVFIEFKELIPLTSNCFDILINGFCKAKKLEDARKIMDEMEKYGYQPNVASYTSFIEAYCREKDICNVDAVLDEMQENGYKPNIVTYTLVMKARWEAGEISQALEVYEKVKSDGCLPGNSFYSLLISILSKADRLHDARKVFDDMKRQNVKPKVWTYNAMISSACAHSREEEALKWLQKMEEDSCKPDRRTYSPLLRLCFRKNRMKVLNFLLNHMFKNDLSIDLGMYALLVSGFCKSGKLELACSYFKEMVLKGMVPYQSTYEVLEKELGEKNMVETKQWIENLMVQAEERRKQRVLGVQA